MTTPPLVYIVVLQYNNSQDTLRCLESLKVQSYPNFRVIVVDNASYEAEVNNIRNYINSQEHNDRVGRYRPTQSLLIVNKENLGYAGGNNIGIKYALENGADYVFILNNDTTVEPDALAKMVEIAESDKNIGIVGPAIKEGEKTAYFGKISWFKTELTHSDSYPRAALGQTLQAKEYVIGAAMLIKREVLEKIEGFDEIYFLYFEDADLNIRTQAAGYKLKVVPEAVVHHQISASTKKLGSPLLLRYHMRNALIFNSLNAPWTVKIFLIFWASYIVLKNILKMFLMPSKATADAIIEGVLDFYKNKFGKINA